LWVSVFFACAYLLMFCYSFWSLSPSQTSSIPGAWRTITNSSEWMCTGKHSCARCGSAQGDAVFSSAGYPLAYFLSFRAGARKDSFYQLVIIPYGELFGAAYAWKTILGSEGVLNTLLQYAHLTSHPLDFLLYSPFAWC